jgi:hypothetical protein
LGAGGAARKAPKVNTFYGKSYNICLFCLVIDPPLHKPDEKYEMEVKKTNERVRRWKVEIFQIEIVNMTTEIIDPFLQIIIGGDYFVRH